ncbi:hypothetical protein M422DRAFT_257050, partial [Sphaerobolus stellatus SS14]
MASSSSLPVPALNAARAALNAALNDANAEPVPDPPVDDDASGSTTPDDAAEDENPAAD